MVYEIVNVSVSGRDGLVTGAATFQVRAAIDGDIIYTETLSVQKRVTAPSGWYAAAKQEFLDKLAVARAKYEDTMGKVIAETGFNSTVEIEADIKFVLEGGLS